MASIRLRYILALLLVALVVSISGISMRYILKTQENDAAIINIAGQQRMLSQRIALFVNRLSNCSKAYSDNVEQLESLTTSVVKFESNHLYLTQLESLPATVHSIYFGPAGADKAVKTYIDQASDYANKPTCNGVPSSFNTLQTDALLTILNNIVQEFENDARDKVRRVEDLELFLWLATLFILGLEAIFIFRPMEKTIVTTISSLDAAIQKAKTAQANAVEASKAKSEFLANMSHELRTPMNGLFGMIELAIDNPTKSSDYLNKAKNAGRQLLMLINDVLDLSKIEAGKLKIENISFDLYQIIDDVVSLQAIYCRKKGLEFEYNKETDLPNAIIGDPTRISQVLHNLLSNAVKFTEEGRVSLHVGVKVQEQKHWLVFEVQDTGVGISQANQENIFNKFEQADQSTTRLYGGTGLGLSISARLTSLMNGKLNVESSEGKGSRFTFSIPIKIDKRKRPIQSDVLLNCAIVDDLQTSREYLEHLVKLQGLQARTYASAKAFLEDNPERFDLLILDLSMPNIDGVDTIESLLSLNIPSIPNIILVSAVLEHLECSQTVREAIWRTHAKPVDRRAIEHDLIELQGLVQQRSVEQDKNLNRSKHILVVEDNEINAEVVRSMLENESYEVSVSFDGQKAIDACLAQDFDLILMDLQMPVLDGLAATKRLRQDYRLKIPIVALTANAFTEDRDQCTEAGMNDFLAKPIDKIKLLSTVKRLIAKGASS